MPISDSKKKWIETHPEAHKLTSRKYSLDHYYRNREVVLQKQRLYYQRKKAEKLQAEQTN